MKLIERIKSIYKNLVNYLGKELRNKKIGILTLPLNSNVGGCLQAYALMETLKELNYQPILLNRRHLSKTKKLKSKEHSLYRLIKKMICCNFSFFTKFKGLDENCPTLMFIEEYISSYSFILNNSSELARYIKHKKIDAIIVGSDQVWRPRYAKNILSDFFLGFISSDSKIKRISYAASFGVPEWEFEDEETKNFSLLLQKFDAVSVREDSGKDLCESKLGVNAQHVLDPTLLLTKEHYIKKFSLNTKNKFKNRLNTYILDLDEDKVKLVNDIANKLSLEPYTPQGIKLGTIEAEQKDALGNSVENWLASFYHSDFVITDSFHGTVFAILFNKPLIVLGNTKRGIARFTSILKVAGLEKKLVFDLSNVNIDEILEPINWKNINQNIKDSRNKSMNFLISSLY